MISVVYPKNISNIGVKLTNITEWLTNQRKSLVVRLEYYTDKKPVVDAMKAIGGIDENYLEVRDFLTARRGVSHLIYVSASDLLVDRLLSDVDCFAAVCEAHKELLVQYIDTGKLVTSPPTEAMRSGGLTLGPDGY